MGTSKLPHQVCEVSYHHHCHCCFFFLFLFFFLFFFFPLLLLSLLLYSLISRSNTLSKRFLTTGHVQVHKNAFETIQLIIVNLAVKAVHKLNFGQHMEYLKFNIVLRSPTVNQTFHISSLFYNWRSLYTRPKINLNCNTILFATQSHFKSSTNFDFASLYKSV